ncbi:MAG: hypothetical protein U0235_05110 [Polyangiaceae bacterium]
MLGAPWMRPNQRTPLDLREFSGCVPWPELPRATCSCQQVSMRDESPEIVALLERALAEFPRSNAYESIRQEVLGVYGAYVSGPRSIMVHEVNDATWYALSTALGMPGLWGVTFPRAFYGSIHAIVVPVRTPRPTAFHEFVHGFTHDAAWYFSHRSTRKADAQRSTRLREACTELLTRRGCPERHRIATGYDGDVAVIERAGVSTEILARAIFQGDLDPLARSLLGYHTGRVDAPNPVDAVLQIWSGAPGPGAASLPEPGGTGSPMRPPPQVRPRVPAAPRGT